MSAVVVLAAGTATSAASASMHSSIPFRHTSIASASELSGILIATVLVLSVFAASAWFARRKGWLDRWSTDAGKSRVSGRSLVVLEVLRISRRTTVYRIASGKQEFLVAESSSPVALTATSAEQERTP